MQWTTEVEFPKSGIRIDWKTNLAFIGSCFAEKMAEKFTRFKFHTWVNPFGIVYNPLSVANMLERISNQKFYSEKEIFSDGEVFYTGKSFITGTSMESFRQKIRNDACGK